MTRSLLRRYPQLRRWAESEDVLQNALIRLDRALTQVPLGKTSEFLAIAATNIRRELCDLVRHYYGVRGIGTNHATPSPLSDQGCGIDDAATSDEDDPSILAQWAELHERIEELPEEERIVLDLHFFHGLTYAEIAAVLGISVRTVHRRCLAALCRLQIRLRSMRPFEDLD